MPLASLTVPDCLGKGLGSWRRPQEGLCTNTCWSPLDTEMHHWVKMLQGPRADTMATLPPFTIKPVLIQKEIKHVLFLTYGLNPVIKEMKHKTQLYTLESISGRKHVATKLKAAPDLRTYFISMSKYVKSARQAFTPAQEERLTVNIMTSSSFSSQRLAFFVSASNTELSGQCLTNILTMAPVGRKCLLHV